MIYVEMTMGLDKIVKSNIRAVAWRWSNFIWVPAAVNWVELIQYGRNAQGSRRSGSNTIHVALSWRKTNGDQSTTRNKYSKRNDFEWEKKESRVTSAAARREEGRVLQSAMQIRQDFRRGTFDFNDKFVSFSCDAITLVQSS